MKELMTVKDIVEMTGVKNGKAYKIIRDLNKELEEKGYLTIRGKINKEYLLKRIGIGAFNNACN